MGRKILLIIVVVGLIIGFGSCGRYNSLVSGEESVEAAWAQVENVYQRRSDLIPNLVNTVKGSANFERETLQAVIEARAQATQMRPQISADVINDPQLLQRYQEVQGELSSAIGRLLVTVERYPDLKATQNFLTLQSQLEGAENRIAVERRKYNDVARGFNTSVRSFPNNIFAGMFGFERKAYFEAAEGADQAPVVEF